MNRMTFNIQRGKKLSWMKMKFKRIDLKIHNA